MEEVIKNALIIIGIPIFRSIAGWAENALKDNKISKFEIKELITTIIRVGIIGFSTFYGLNGMGIDVNAVGAGSAAILVDMLFSKIKKKN